MGVEGSVFRSSAYTISLRCMRPCPYILIIISHEFVFFLSSLSFFDRIRKKIVHLYSNHINEVLFEKKNHDNLGYMIGVACMHVYTAQLLNDQIIIDHTHQSCAVQLK